MRGLRTVIIPDPNYFVGTALALFLGKHRPVRDKGDMHEFATSSNFGSNDQFEKVMRAFSRALGLAIAYHGLIYPAVRLKFVLVRGLRTHVSTETLAKELDLTEVERNNLMIREDSILRKVYMPVFYIRKGIREVLAAMGIDALTEAEWLDRGLAT